MKVRERRLRGNTRHLLTCPFCGAEVIADDVALTIGHEEPECEAFTRAVKNMGGGDGVEQLVATDEWLKKGAS